MTSGAPSPAEIAAARQAAGFTLFHSAELMHVNIRTWQKWESGESVMHPAFWELYRIKVARSRAKAQSLAQAGI
jgi:DNA-binding transcriptional regulator YiaG